MSGQTGHTHIHQALSSYKILADTSFVMQPGFEKFVAENAHLIRRNPILVSRLVLAELHRLLRSRNTQKQDTAKRTLNALMNLFKCGYVDVRHEASDKYVDIVIQRVVEQNFLSHDFLVLTNDVGLMEDLYANKEKKSVQSSRDLIVAKLHGASQKLEIFIPKRTTVNDYCKSLAGTFSPCVFPKPFAAITTLSPSSDSKLSARTMINSGDRVHLSDGSAVTLGKELAHGGEGTVFEITGRDEVCKIYHLDKLTSDREQKVRLMLTRKLGDPAICWPSALVVDRHRIFRGYVMSRASGKPLAHSLFVPKLWLEENPAWNRRHSVRLAINILERICYLHRLNVLLGDINPLNILVKNENTTYFVDCDSYQIEGFPCPVGTVNFTAPEIQGVDFRTFLRSPEHELFAVATLMFMILMPGKLPYSHQGGESGYLNIKEMHFSYPLGDNHSNGAPLGPWRFCWSHLTYGVKEAFYRTFHSDYRHKSKVKLDEWLKLLKDYEKLLSIPPHTFFGPKRQIGFDLSILPQNLRIVAGQEKVPVDNGKTDMEKDFHKLRIATVRRTTSIRQTSTTAYKALIRKPSTAGSQPQRYGYKQPAVSAPFRIQQNVVSRKTPFLFRFIKWFFN